MTKESGCQSTINHPARKNWVIHCILPKGHIQSHKYQPIDWGHYFQ